jgi:hypothetical protein
MTKKVSFNLNLQIYETYNSHDYDRTTETSVLEEIKIRMRLMELKRKYNF